MINISYLGKQSKKIKLFLQQEAFGTLYRSIVSVSKGKGNQFQLKMQYIDETQNNQIDFSYPFLTTHGKQNVVEVFCHISNLFLGITNTNALRTCEKPNFCVPHTYLCFVAKNSHCLDFLWILATICSKYITLPKPKLTLGAIVVFSWCL